MSDWKQPWECSQCGALSMHWLDESEEACECLNCDRIGGGMSFEKIEAQIMGLRKHEEQTPLDQNEMDLIDACGRAADTMQAMLDVVRAAEGTMRWYDGAGDIREVDSLSYALDKLREMEALKR